MISVDIHTRTHIPVHMHIIIMKSLDWYCNECDCSFIGCRQLASSLPKKEKKTYCSQEQDIVLPTWNNRQSDFCMTMLAKHFHGLSSSNFGRRLHRCGLNAIVPAPKGNSKKSTPKMEPKRYVFNHPVRMVFGSSNISPSKGLLTSWFCQMVPISRHPSRQRPSFG